MEVTLKIDHRTKIGKTLLSFIEFFAKENKEVEIVDITKKSPYNPEFVKMIKEAEKEKGGIHVKSETLWTDLGLYSQTKGSKAYKGS